MFGQDVDTLAYELNVTPSLIIAWREQFSETRCQ